MTRDGPQRHKKKIAMHGHLNVKYATVLNGIYDFVGALLIFLTDFGGILCGRSPQNVVMSP